MVRDEVMPQQSTDNIGKIDRTVRVFGGIILLYASHGVTGALGFIIEGIGFYAVLTGFLGTCFVYHILNFSTNG